MFKTYISPKFFYLCGLITLVFLWIFDFHLLIFFWTIIIAMIMILFKKGMPASDPSISHPDKCLSPINGIVKSVRYGVFHPFFGRDLIEVRFILPFFVEMGLYLPFAGEVTEVKKVEGFPYFRFNEAENEKETPDDMEVEKEGEITSGFGGMVLKLKGPKGQMIGLKILRCFFGLFPRVWVIAGDRGIHGANFGYLPMGGAIFMYLPTGTDVLVKESDHVLAGQTLVAQMPALK